MILFKACPRCGGDVDTSYSDDIYCLQCGNRPETLPLRRRTRARAQEQSGTAAKGPTTGSGDSGPVDAQLTHAPSERRNFNPAECRRCGSVEVVRLGKARADDNTCFRCLRCGHIYSPARPVARMQRG